MRTFNEYRMRRAEVAHYCGYKDEAYEIMVKVLKDVVKESTDGCPPPKPAR